MRGEPLESSISPKPEAAAIEKDGVEFELGGGVGESFMADANANAAVKAAVAQFATPPSVSEASSSLPLAESLP